MINYVKKAKHNNFYLDKSKISCKKNARIFVVTKEVMYLYFDVIS